MANGGRIEYTLGFKVDTSSLGQIDKIFEKLNKINSGTLIDNGLAKNATDAINKINQGHTAAEKLRKAMYDAFNQVTGTTNMDKFNKSLEKSGTNLKSIYASMRGFGAAGEQAFRDMTTQVFRTNGAMEKTVTTLDRISNTLKHSLKWQLSAAAIQGTISSIEEAYRYVVKLDTSLNNIQIVTQKSADEMERFAKQANAAAQGMGASTTAYTDAALIYYQEGLNTEDAETLADLTVKIANVTGESSEQVSQNVTAVVNGYQIAYQDAEQVMDKLAIVAANSASNLNELSTAMSKTAASANMVGMDVDKLTAAISTTISVTRQAPESVGTAYKTILARLGDLKLGETGEDGETLGSVSSDLQKLGINILDAEGNLRDMGSVIEEIGTKWQDWDTSTKQAAAISMAGKRQYTMLSALFDNWDRYQDMMGLEADATGTLQQQQDTYMESTAAHVQSMKTAFENAKDSFFDLDTVETFTDSIASAANVFASFLDSIGGGNTVLAALGTVGMKVFSKQLASGITQTTNQIIQATQRTREYETQIGFMKDIAKTMSDSGVDQYTKQIINMESEMAQMKAYIPEDQWQGVLSILEATTAQMEKISSAEQQIETKATDVKNSWEQISSSISTSDTSIDSNQMLEKIKNEIKNNPNANSFEDINFSGPGQAIFEKLKVIEDKKIELDSIISKPLTLNIKDIQSQVPEVNIQMKNLLETIDKTGTQEIFEEKLIEKIKELSTTTDKTTGTIKDYQDVIKKLEPIIKNITKDFDSFKESVFRTVPSVEEEKRQLEQLNEAFEKISSTAKLSKLTSQVLRAVGGIGSLAMGIQQITSLGSIWENQDLSDGEKLLETITSLSFALPMLVSGIQSVVEIQKAFVAFSKVANAELLVSGVAIKNNTKAEEFEAASKLAVKLATEGKTEAEIKETLATNVLTKKIDENTRSNLANAAAKGVNASATEKSAAASKKLIASLGSGIGKFITSPVGIATIAIGVLAGSIYLTYKNLHAAQNEFSNFNNTIDSVSQSINDMSSAATNLNKTFNSLGEKQKTLDGLKRGSVEWKEALSELNNESKELKENYDDLQNTLDSNKTIKLNSKTDKDKIDLFGTDTLTSQDLELIKNVDYYVNYDGTIEYTDTGVAKMEVVAQEVQLNANRLETANILAEATLENNAINEQLIGDTVDKTLGRKITAVAKNDPNFDKSRVNDYKYLKDTIGASDKELDKYFEIPKAMQKNFSLENSGLSKEDIKAISKEANKKANKLDKSGAYVDDIAEAYLKDLQTWKDAGISQETIDSFFNSRDIISETADELNRLGENGEKVSNNMNDIVNGLQAFISGQTDTEAYKLAQDNIDEEYRASAFENLAIDNERFIEKRSEKYSKNISKEDREQYAKELGYKVEEDWLGREKYYNGDEEVDIKSIDKVIASNKALKDLEEERLNNAEYINREYAQMEENTENLVEATKKLKKAQTKNTDWNDVKDLDNLDSNKGKIKKYIKNNQQDIESQFGFGKGFLDKGNGRKAFLKQWDNYKKMMLTTNEAERKKLWKEILDNTRKDKLKLDLKIDSDASAKELVSNMDNLIETVQSDYTPDELEEGVSINLTPDNVEYRELINGIKQGIGEADGSVESIIGGLEEEFGVKIELGDGGKIDFDTINPNELIKAISPGGSGTVNVDGEDVPVRIRITGKSGGQNVLGGSPTGADTAPKGNKPGGSGGGGGGGKGKGGGKKNPKKKLGEGYNAYYKQEKALDKLQRVYDQLDKTSDRTFGLDKVKSIKAQNKNIVEQTKYLAQELDITRKIAKEYQTEGTKKFGFKFDSETGVITNYNDIVEKAREKYNKSNRGEKATEKFEELVQWAEDYESEVVSKLNEELDEMADKIDEFVENSLEKIDAYIEIHTDYSDLLETWQEFRRDIVNDIKDDDYLNLNKFALTNIKEIFDNGLLDTYVTESQKALEGILNIKNGGMDANYFNDEASALEHLKDGVEGIMEYWTNIKSLMDEAGDNYVSAIEKASDEISKQMDIYEAINSQYEHDMNVISSLYGEDSYRMQQAYTQAQLNNSNMALDLARENAKLMEDTYKLALENGNEEGIQTAKEAWLDAIDTLNSKVEESIENISNNYKTVIMASVEEMTNAFTSGFGTDILQDELNSIFANDEVFLDAVNRGYAIQDLASKWQSAIDGSSNVEVQERLNQLMQDQLGYLEEKGELTQYDIDRAEKEYEIALKQIALQEAQQNKSKMRLVRDANGNYTYKYTSDEDQIKKAQDELNKLQNELYNMDKEKIRTNLGDILGAYNDMTDELQKIAESEILTEEQKREKMLEIARNYYEKVGKLASQNSFINSNLNASSLMSGVNASTMQWYNQTMGNMNSFNAGILGTNMESVIETILTNSKESQAQYETMKELSGRNFDELLNGNDATATSLQSLLVNNKDLVDTQKEQIIQTADYYAQIVELFNNANKMLQDNSNLIEEALKYVKIWSDETTGQETYSSAKKNGMVESGDAAQLNSDIKLGGFSVKSGTGVMIGDIQGSKAYIMTADNKVGWIDKDKLTGFDTGGYTGSWGKEGRLAMLHQKELVLNQQDTENMLNVVKATRDMVNNLKANSAATISNAIKSNYINGIGNESGIVEQDVRIEATFPNVQTATEIETALNNLINTASQRVMQNKK